MGRVVDISPESKALREAREHLATTLATPTDAKKRKEAAKLIVARHLEGLMAHAESNPVSFNRAYGMLVTAYEHGVLAEEILAAIRIAWPSKTKLPSRATCYSLYKAFKRHEDGEEGALVPQHRGRVVGLKSWHQAALTEWGRPQKPAVAQVARALRSNGFDVTDHQVRYFVDSLPDDVKNARRLGPKLYRDSMRRYRVMSYHTLNVGDIFQGDGHTIDVYLAHPITGKPYRPELSVWIDLRSRYIPGFYVSDAESSISTLFSLSAAMINHNHQPVGVHVDNGSGYISKLMNDASTGFYAKFGMEVVRSLPGNSKGKGVVERFFRTLRDQFDKQFPSYCGSDMSPEALRKVLKDASTGKVPLPSMQDYYLRLEEWIDYAYHHQAHSGLDDDTPASMWEQRDHFELSCPADAIVRPRITRTVTRQRIRLHGRMYTSEGLLAFNQKEVVVEYDLKDDAEVVVYTSPEGRFITTAVLEQRSEYLSPSRIQDARIARRDNAIRRKQAHIQEDIDRASRVITADDSEALDTIAPLLIENSYAQIERGNAAIEDGDLLRDSILQDYRPTHSSPASEPSLDTLDFTLRHHTEEHTND